MRIIREGGQINVGCHSRTEERQLVVSVLSCLRGAVGWLQLELQQQSRKHERKTKTRNSIPFVIALQFEDAHKT
jgi:hypothetical protein